MIHYSRGTQIPLAYTFVDDTGATVTVASASFTVIYPSSTPPGGLLLRDPGQLKGKETLVASESGGEWSATWDSSVADPGAVYWVIVSATPKMTHDETFVLEGNLANLEAF